MAWDGPKCCQEDFPTNPDLADILGRTDLDFENFHFFHFVDPKFLDFQVPKFPKFGAISGNFCMDRRHPKIGPLCSWQLKAVLGQGAIGCASTGADP